jgi:hypothetical protein
VLGLTTILVAVFAVRRRSRAAGSAGRTSSATGASPVDRTTSTDRTSPARPVEQTSTTTPPAARASSPTTTVAPAKQTAASDHVDVDWSRELWGNPDWLRILGDQPSSDAAMARGSPEAKDLGSPQTREPRSAEVENQLQRTLGNDTPDMASEFVTKVAI